MYDIPPGSTYGALRGRKTRWTLGLTVAATVLASASSALAWGATGHRLIGMLAIEALPTGVPGFLRTPEMAATIGEIAREPDRDKSTGDPHDADLNPGHFIDLDDNGKIRAGQSLAELPTNRAAYDALQRGAGSDGYQEGYLPYSVIEGWQQLVKDLAYWRVETWALAHAPAGERHDWLERDLRLREQLTARDLGYWAHFVGDGSMPLHVSVHFNGWGNFPNPKGYTNEKVHGPFESVFVRSFIDAPQVRARLRPYGACGCSIQQHTAAYLDETLATVEPFYALEKAGGFKDGDARGRAFAADRLAAGASVLRDMIVDAWTASAAMNVGYPPILPTDVEAGKVDPYDPLFGED